MADVRSNRLAWATSIIVCCVIFGLLANERWVPGGDSELYVATARNLLLRKFSLKTGYIFNGQPMNMVPPGWPYLLALAMKLSTRFVFLKALVMLSMLGSMAMAYPIIRRFAPPAVSASIVALTALLSHIFPLTFWLHSDAMFCLLGTASFLLAFQIAEGRTQAWRIALLCAVCAAAVTVRWAGVLNWLIVAAILLNDFGLRIGPNLFRPSYWTSVYAAIADWLARPRIARAGIALLLSGAVTFGTFEVWRIALAVTPEQLNQIREAGGTEEVPVDARADAMTHQEYNWFNATESGWHGYIARTLGWGDWFSFLFWQPFRFHAIKWLNLVSNGVGWLAILPLMVLVVRGLATRQWLWPAVALYGFALAMTWPHPNARYLVPIAFLLLTSLWAGSEAIKESWPAIAPLLRGALICFLATYLLCNGTLWAVEVWVQRSSHFYDRYEAGLNKDLISASRWLIEHPLGPNEAVACSERYVNLSTSARTSKLGLRVTTMLTGRPIITIPKKYMRGIPAPNSPPDGPPLYVATTQPDYIFDPDPESNPFFLRWARILNVRYYLYQPPVSPWRASHFRVAWLEERATHTKLPPANDGWRLYEIPRTGSHAIPIKNLPTIDDWPLCVPGI
jgi:hypothetical protein